MERWSISLGRVFGVTVRLHLFFLLLLPLAMVWSGSMGRTVSRGVLLWLLLLGAVAVRETARALAAAGLRLRLRELMLLPTGGVASFSAGPEKRVSEGRRPRVLALAGPLANTLAGLCVGALVWTVSPGVDLVSLPWVSPVHLLRTAVWLNLLLAALNLLPVWPLDGGEFAPAGRGAGSIVAAVLAGSGLVLGNLWLMMAGIGVFLAMQMDTRALLRTEAAAQDAGGVGSPKVKDVMLTEYSVLSASATLEDAMLQVRHTLQDVFPVVRAGNLVGSVGQADVLHTLATGGNGYVQGMMNRSFQVAAPEDRLADMLGRLAGGAAAQLVPVIENGRVVGILTLANLRRSVGATAQAARVRSQRQASEEEQD